MRAVLDAVEFKVKLYPEVVNVPLEICSESIRLASFAKLAPDELFRMMLLKSVVALPPIDCAADPLNVTVPFLCVNVPLFVQLPFTFTP